MTWLEIRFYQEKEWFRMKEYFWRNERKLERGQNKKGLQSKCKGRKRKAKERERERKGSTRKKNERQ